MYPTVIHLHQQSCHQPVLATILVAYCIAVITLFKNKYRMTSMSQHWTGKLTEMLMIICAVTSSAKSFMLHIF